MATAENGKTVKVHYTGKLESGDVFDSSKDKDPLEFTMGAGQMIPGFEKGIVGMAEGETKTVTVSPEDGYGEKRDDLIAVYDKSMFPPEIDLKEGMLLESKTDSGQVIPLVVEKIEGDQVTLDANHFLSGKTLIFEIELISVS